MKLSIHFGPLAPLLESQLGHQGMRLVGSKLQHIQKDADALARLAVRGVLSGSEASNARRRLLKVILKQAERV